MTIKNSAKGNLEDSLVLQQHTAMLVRCLCWSRDNTLILPLLLSRRYAAVRLRASLEVKLIGAPRVNGIARHS